MVEIIDSLNKNKTRAEKEETIVWVSLTQGYNWMKQGKKLGKERHTNLRKQHYKNIVCQESKSLIN